MSSQSGFDYDLLISRLHGGVRAFQSLRAHRRQRDQPPPPPRDERPTPPPSRPSQPYPDEPAEARVVSSLEPQAFIAVNGRVVPLFGDLGAGMFAPASPAGPMPPTSTDTPPAQPRPAPSPAPEETRPPTPAPAPAPSPLKLPLPKPPARLGLIYGGQPRSPATEPPPPAAATQSPTIDGPATLSTSPAEVPSIAVITALLDARSHEEALRLEKIHAEHRAYVTELLQEHRNELRAQREADAARTTQLIRDLLAEHRAELAQATRTHADHLAQILAQHHQHAQTATPSDDTIRSALLEQAKLQREVTEATAEHIGALTTTVADLGQTVGMLAMAAVQGSPAVKIPPIAKSPPPSPPGVPQPSRAPTIAVSPPTLVSDRARILPSVNSDRDDDELTITHEDDEPPSRSRLPPLTPLAATEEHGDA